MKSFPLPQHVENYDKLMDMFGIIRPNDWIIRDNLDYLRKILTLLDNPEKNLGKIVHITGTNGKGSVSWKIARSIEANFSGEDKRVGLYVSPNIYEFEERITINGNPISQSDMIKYTNIILDKIHSKSIEGQPDYIDFRIGMVGILVCIAFLYFRDQKVDYSIIEGGIGAKMDHTNVISSDIAVITSIGLDHVEFLGDTVEKIAADKAHIIKPNTPVVIGPRVKNTGKSLDVIKEKANQENLTEDQVIVVPHPAIQNFEADNQETAKNVLHTMFGPQFIITDAIYSSPPGRYQKVVYSVAGRAMPCIFDVCHNPDAFEATFARCSNDFPEHKFILMLGINPTKDIPQICSKINKLEKLTDVLLYSDDFRITKPEKTFAELEKDLNVQYYRDIDSIDDYLEHIIEKSDENFCIIVAGSFYTVMGISNAMKVNVCSLKNEYIPGNSETIDTLPVGKSTSELALYFRTRMRGKSISLAYNQLKPLIEEHLLPQSSETSPLKILDLGCGTGTSSILIRQVCVELGVNAEVNSVDINSESIEQAKTEDPDGNYQVINRNNLPFPDGIFDMVISVFVFLEQKTVDEMVKLILEAKRVMKDDSVLTTINCATKLYNPENKWVSIRNNHPENTSVLADKANNSGKEVRVTVKKRDAVVIFRDLFWRGRDYKDAYKRSGMELVQKIKPLAKPNSFNTIWRSETKQSPFIVHVLKKTTEDADEDVKLIETNRH